MHHQLSVVRARTVGEKDLRGADLLLHLKIGDGDIDSNRYNDDCGSERVYATDPETDGRLCFERSRK